MASDRVTVIARTKTRPGMEKRLAEVAGALVGPTRQEEGCISHDLHRCAGDPLEFYFYENRRSQDDLDRCLETPHVKEHRELLQELAENGVEIALIEKISAPAAARQG